MGNELGLRERKKRQTSEALIAAGLALFADRGYEQTTVADIADAVDVSARTFFRYFDTKDQLLFSGHTSRVEGLAEALRTSDELTAATLTDAVFEFFGRDLERSVAQMRVQLGVAAVHPPSRARLHQHQADLVDVVAAELGRRRLARPLEAQMLASAIIVAVREMSLPWLLDGEPDLPVQLHEARERLRNLSPLAAAS